MEISNKRCIQILKLLLKNKECMTGDNLAVSIGVSSRTIRNDMKDLNRALEDHGASVVSEIGQGYYLKIEDQEKFLTFQNEMEEHKREKDFKNIIPSEPEDRVKYIISKLLLSTLNGRKEKIEFFDLEEELFISTSTLKKDFRNIDKVLKPYDLKTSITKKDGVKIVGDEAKIRYCISEYIFNSKGYFGIEENQFYQSIFKEQEIEKLREILLDVISVYNLRLTDLAIQYYEESLELCKQHGKASTDLMKLYNKKRQEAAEAKDDEKVKEYMDKVQNLMQMSKDMIRGNA